jgi:hypothetical protein
MGERREKQTLIPAFDPSLLARELEDAAERPTLTPAFDPTSYARMVDDHLESAPSSQRDTPRTMTAATPALAGVASEPSDEATTTIGRAMYGSYLASDYPEALVLAERVLEREPDHALAKLVADGCRERLGTSVAPRLSPSSVLRLKRQPFELVELVEIGGIESAAVLAQIDGVADVAMVAELAGIPRPEALDRLHTLLQMGLLEVVNG